MSAVGSLNSTLGTRPRVYKQQLLFGCSTCNPGPHYATDKPWVGVHPTLGAKHFDTWAEAVWHACAKLMMWNAA